MSIKISIVINTLDEQENLPRALKSIKSFADEIVVVDMHSTDNTTKIATKAGAKVYQHPRVGYVEPARNFAISKATGNWILILDADEVVPHSLATTLCHLAETDQADYIRLPRKNLVFGQWIHHSRWWPDYNIRFFKKDHVTWQSAIHSIPITHGQGIDLQPTEENALIHYHYQSISQFLDRTNRYTDHQLQVLKHDDYQFQWPHLITKPTNEFLSRYFDGQGYLDGLHGLVLAILQAFTEFIIYLKAWESEDFKPLKIDYQDFQQAIDKPARDLHWWLLNEKITHSRSPFKPLLRIKRLLLRLLP